jgi:hypothetical protein
MPRALYLLVVMLIVWVPQHALGAEMSFGKDDVGQLWLQVVGPIGEGDDARFRSMLVDAIGQQLQINNVSIYAPGGSAIPAMKIGRYVRMLHLTTVAPEALPLLRLRICRLYSMSGKPTVIDYNPLTGRGDSRCICAGECFLVWSAGTARIWSGVELRRISEHGEPARPVPNADGATPAIVADYLREMSIPEPTIVRITALHPGESEYLTADERNMLETKTGLPRPEEPYRSRCRTHTPTSPAALACENAVTRELYWDGARRLLNQSE